MADNPQTPVTDDAAEKLAQEVKIEDAGPARKKITIEVPVERISDKISSNFDDLRADAVLPGFRRGRAPQRLIEKRFGKDVRKDVKTQLMAESYQQVVDDEDLRVIGEPDVGEIDEIELPDDGPFTFSFEVEIVPDFELPELTGIEVNKQKVEITDDQVDAELDRYCQMQGRMTAVDGAIQSEDYVAADVTIAAADAGADDEPLDKKEGQNIYVPPAERGKGHVGGIIIDDLADQLTGKKAGDSVTLTARGPAQHENEDLREKELSITIDVTRVERLAKAKVEDMLPMLGFESEDELREQVKSSLSARAEAEQQADLHKQVTDKLVESVDFDLPQGLTGKQTERILQRRQLDLMYRGASPQDVEEQLAELRTASQAEAQHELKAFFILDKVAEKLGVEVDEAEVNGRIAQMAVQQNARPEKVRQEMARSGRLEQLFIQLREQKTLDRVLQDAKVNEVEAEKPEPKDEAKTTKKKTTRKKSTKKKTTRKKSSSD